MLLTVRTRTLSTPLLAGAFFVGLAPLDNSYSREVTDNHPYQQGLVGLCRSDHRIGRGCELQADVSDMHSDIIGSLDGRP